MTGWYAERTPDRSAKAMIAVTLLALSLVAAVPVALLAAVVMMMLGYVVGGLALFGGSVLAAAIAVALAGMNGMRHLRKLLFGDFRRCRGGCGQVAAPGGSHCAGLFRALTRIVFSAHRWGRRGRADRSRVRGDQEVRRRGG